MQFKHPEILYFLFLLVIPILVHLFQLRRFKKEFFTNVRFLKELSIQTRKSSKLKKWLLLATRLSILAAMIFAFAQPFFKAKDSKNVTNEMFIVLDNSFSMQAKGQKGELLKRAVEDLLQHVPENQSFSLITNTETFWNSDIRSVRSDLQKLSYSANPFELDNLLSKINARQTPYTKDIIVITDAIGLTARQLKSVETDENTMFIVPKGEQSKNVSVDSVFIEQTLENFYEIGVRLSAYGEDIGEIPIAIFNGDKLAAKTVVQFDKNRKEIKFTIPKDDFHGYVSITDNGLQYDNNFYFSITKPQKTNVLSIGEQAVSSFLAKIYTPDEFNYRNFPLANVDYNILEQQDAIVLNELKDIPQALQTTLKAFVEKGGNVIVIPSSESSVSSLNSFLSNFGNIRFGDLQQVEKMVTKIAFSHPLYASVFEKKIENFQYPNTEASFGISGNTPSILGYADQSAFLTQVSSVYVFAAPINRDYSNFQNSPLIVPTFYNMAHSVSKTGISAITIGSGQPYFVDAQLAREEIVNVSATNSKSEENFIPVQQILNNKVKLTFEDFPAVAGNYSVYNKGDLLKNISFNYNRTEGDLAAANVDLLDDYTVISNIETVFDTLQTDRTSNELWKWFVILTLLLLVTELLIQKFVR
ncbi:MAG TPA: BatA and WFA domain-containing protein [Flavobacterium sp.]|jgi:hypothetical protein